MKRSTSPRKRRARRTRLTVSVERRGGRIAKITVSGHAGFAERGRDIVCAAVSALVQTAAYGLRRHCGARARVKDVSDGDYTLDVAGGNAAAQAVLETTVSGLEALARSYPDHVVVSRREAGRRGR